MTCTALLRTIAGNRRVYDALWNGRAVIVKQFLHKVKSRYHLKREWRRLCLLHNRGLNSPKPLFVGQTQNGSWAMVVEKIAGSSTVLNVFHETSQMTGKLELLVLVCKELAGQHSKGVLQKDLHLGNFLLAGGKVFALDAGQMHLLRHELGRKSSIAQLAKLACCLPENDTKSIARLCEEYFCARGWQLKKSDEALFWKRLTAHRKRSLGKGLKRCLRTSKRHLQIKTNRYVAEFDRGFCRGAEPLNFIKQIDMLMDDGQILKNSDTCCVSRITWNNKDIVVKRYNHKGFIHSLRHTLKRSRAYKGWLHAHHLEALNIATPEPLAYIEHRRGLLIWQSYLVTEYVDGQKLYDFLRDDNITEQQRIDEIQRVVKLLGKLWKYRTTHGDLKHSNVLITENGPVLTDLDGMIAHRWELPYRNRRAKDMERFLKKTDISPALHNYCRLLISGKRQFSQKPADDFDKMRTDNWIIRIRKDFPKEDIKNLISVNAPLAEGRGQFIKVPSSDYTNVFRCNISINGISHTLYLKRYLCRSAMDFVKHLFRPSRARRAFNASLMLQKNGFDAPAVIGLFERRLGPFYTDNFLLTEDVDKAKSALQLLADICENSGKNTSVHKRTLITAFAKTIGQMHAKGIFHGDLRLGNVLVVKEGQNWRFFFIDNERTKKFYHLPDRFRLKNMVQVNMFQCGISNIDRLRFFKTYLRENPSIARKQNKWGKKIVAKTNHRLRKKDWLED